MELSIKPLPRISSSVGDNQWRGKYLRALQIRPQQPASRVDGVDFMRQEQQRMLQARHSGHQSTNASTTTTPLIITSSNICHNADGADKISQLNDDHHHHSNYSSNNNKMGNPFDLTAWRNNHPHIRPRRRRCHTDPFALEEHISAPIEIPMGSRRSDLDDIAIDEHVPPLVGIEVSSRPTRKRDEYLAWENQVGLDNQNTLEEDVHEDDEDEQDEQEVWLTADGHDMEEDGEEDDIFEMEGVEISNGQQRRRKPKSQRPNTGMDGQLACRSGLSMSSETSTSSSSRLASRRRSLQTTSVLSESFVPPHQLIERDCFSLGIQYELKQRRPVQI